MLPALLVTVLPPPIWEIGQTHTGDIPIMIQNLEDNGTLAESVHATACQ